jgi:hypothetical protein
MIGNHVRLEDFYGPNQGLPHKLMLKYPKLPKKIGEPNPGLPDNFMTLYYPDFYNTSTSDE